MDKEVRQAQPREQRRCQSPRSEADSLPREVVDLVRQFLGILRRLRENCCLIRSGGETDFVGLNTDEDRLPFRLALAPDEERDFDPTIQFPL